MFQCPEILQATICSGLIDSMLRGIMVEATVIRDTMVKKRHFDGYGMVGRWSSTSTILVPSRG